MPGDLASRLRSLVFVSQPALGLHLDNQGIGLRPVDEERGA